MCVTRRLRKPFFWFIGAGIFLDQLSKIIVMWGAFAPLEVTPFLTIQAVINRGVSFGLLGGLGPTYLILLTFVIAAVFLVMMLRENHAFSAWSYALVVSGALSNILDRVFLGGVFDFIDFHIWSYHWPTFNFADVYITVGAFGLLIDSLHLHQKSRKK